MIAYDSSDFSLTQIATLRDLEVGSTYTVTVRAFNEIGESADSNSLVIYAGVVPSKIDYLEWEASTTTSVTFRW